MSEVAVNVGFLLLGALVAFIPQELSRRWQERRERRRELWKRDVDRVAKLEALLSKALSDLSLGRSLSEEQLGEISGLSYALIAYPSLQEKLDEITKDLVAYIRNRGAPGLDAGATSKKIRPFLLECRKFFESQA